MEENEAPQSQRAVEALLERSNFNTLLQPNEVGRAAQAASQAALTAQRVVLTAPSSGGRAEQAGGVTACFQQPLSTPSKRLDRSPGDSPATPLLPSRHSPAAAQRPHPGSLLGNRGSGSARTGALPAPLPPPAPRPLGAVTRAALAPVRRSSAPPAGLRAGTQEE